MSSSVSLAAAFLAGLFSFISPCVLPIVPGYLSVVSGLTVAEVQEGSRRHLGHIAATTGLFILGFSVVFTLKPGKTSGIVKTPFGYQLLWDEWWERDLVDMLRREMGGISDMGDGYSTSTLEPETVRMLERERITSEAAAARCLDSHRLAFLEHDGGNLGGKLLLARGGELIAWSVEVFEGAPLPQAAPTIPSLPVTTALLSPVQRAVDLAPPALSSARENAPAAGAGRSGRRSHPSLRGGVATRPRLPERVQQLRVGARDLARPGVPERRSRDRARRAGKPARRWPETPTS